jgi:hypothetical protein
MSELHDNTVPAKRGSYNISKTGIVYYFPIQDSAFLKPFMALLMFQRADGELFCSIDQRWAPLQGIDE